MLVRNIFQSPKKELLNPVHIRKTSSLSGGSAKKEEKRRKIIREGIKKRLKSPVKISKNI